MENYEAIGRYISFKEKALGLATTRNNFLKDLVHLVRMSLDAETSPMIAVSLDFAKAEELLEKAANAHYAMSRAVVEANAAADACGHPRLVVGKCAGLFHKILYSR
ncbi:MAG: hypothetical protein NG747_13230 [Candidatus Brocadia sp.]|nr:hypothetical protein [Candidatus Brocadia sp.]